MKLRLVASTPSVEALIATAVLTTTSGAEPSVLYDRMQKKPEKAAEIIDRIEVQHGSVLEHNRFMWVAEATHAEILELALKNRFFTVTRLGGGRWAISGNLRAAIEGSAAVGGGFSREVKRTITERHPRLQRLIGGEPL